jgi:hypothetical protein
MNAFEVQEDTPSSVKGIILTVLICSNAIFFGVLMITGYDAYKKKVLKICAFFFPKFFKNLRDK